jgi:hypothetical protein
VLSWSLSCAAFLFQMCSFEDVSQNCRPSFIPGPGSLRGSCRVLRDLTQPQDTLLRKEWRGAGSWGRDGKRQGLLLPLAAQLDFWGSLSGAGTLFPSCSSWLPPMPEGSRVLGENKAKAVGLEQVRGRALGRAEC